MSLETLEPRRKCVHFTRRLAHEGSRMRASTGGVWIVEDRHRVPQLVHDCAAYLAIALVDYFGIERMSSVGLTDALIRCLDESPPLPKAAVSRSASVRRERAWRYRSVVVIF